MAVAYTRMLYHSQYRIHYPSPTLTQVYLLRSSSFFSSSSFSSFSSSFTGGYSHCPSPSSAFRRSYCRSHLFIEVQVKTGFMSIIISFAGSRGILGSIIIAPYRPPVDVILYRFYVTMIRVHPVRTGCELCM